ncbi:hypothetical protein [Variovorax soli]|jgi:hypothetical protein|uniref:hypothetical protein n=1 Tax=Variovorax soli TaxID=376815 RepID=UPI0008382F79|nr:hypothetical protein [Variovorax soli]
MTTTWTASIPRARRAATALALGGALLALGGCAYYVPAAYPVTSAAPASFDRSFSAASNAMRDQGLAIRTEDRGSGVIVGTQGGATVTANIRQQADGSVRVQFDANGPRDPALIDRVSRGYDAYMGR